MVARLVFLAPPGAGKGTQALQMKQAFEILHLSTGEALRGEVKQVTPIGKKVQKLIDSGELVSDAIVLQIVRDQLSKNPHTGWILDGFPRNESQAIILDEMLVDMGESYYQAVYFEVPDRILMERVAQRYKETQRKDDKPEVFSQRLTIYRDNTAPLIDFYKKRQKLVVLDGSQPIDKVFHSLKFVLGLHL
jgi:adenylate kinase